MGKFFRKMYITKLTTKEIKNLQGQLAYGCNMHVCSVVSDLSNSL